ncbi:MAG: ATP-binding protein [Edaphocola sp.]
MTKPLPNSINQGESETLEFKTSFGDEVIVSLVAFANTKGGTVCIGVSDEGKIKGVDVGKETVQNWINEIKGKTASAIIPDVEIIEEEDKTIVLFKIQEYPIKPVAVKGKCYKRTGNANHLMSVEEIANEHLKTINTSWDFYIDPNHATEHVSLDKVNRFIKKIEQRTDLPIPYSPFEFLSKMEMIREGKLTFGAYLLFVSDYCPISDVQIGRFKSDITIIDSVSMNTDLFAEVDEIMAFVKKHLMVEYIITGTPQRTERFDYPLDAIREIVVNMVVHRDYRDSSGSVIKIFDNRIEFYNPGKLFGGITIQDLLTGHYTSKSRNKLIAKAFKEAGLIERYGSGIYRIQNICKEYGVISPVFEEMANGFRIVLFNEKIEVTDKVTDRVTDKVTDRVTDNQRKMLLLFEEDNGISTGELAERIGISRRKIKENIAKLKEVGLIERIGPAKGGYWKINPDKNI